MESVLTAKHPFPFIWEVEPTTQLGATGSGSETQEATVTFDGFYTIMGITSTARGRGTPHPDMRIKIGTGGAYNWNCNKAFSLRALTSDGAGFWFKQEFGDNLYVMNGDQISVEITNDTSTAEYVSLQLVCVRGWIDNDHQPLKLDEVKNIPDGMKLPYYDAAKTTPRTYHNMFPHVWVVEPTSAVANGSASDYVSLQFGQRATIMSLHYAIRATAEGTSHDDIRAKIKLPTGVLQQDTYMSLKALTNDNAGLRFMDLLGKPLMFDSQDRIEVDFQNDTGGSVTPSLVLIGMSEHFDDTMLKEFTKIIKAA